MTYQEVVEIADQLSVAEKARLIEHLSIALQQALQSDAMPELSWQEFINQTAGSLADDPIERPPQLPLETREPLE